MSPINDELRNALQARADRLEPPSELFAAVERRAHRIHRRRVTAAVAGTVLAVAAVGVAVPVLTDAFSTHRVSAPPAGGTDTVSPSPTPSQTPSSVPSLAGPMGWPYVGMNTAADAANRFDFSAILQPKVADVWPGARVDTLVPVMGNPMAGDRLVLVGVASVRADDGVHYVAAAWVKLPGRPAEIVGLHDIGTDVAEVSVVLPRVAGEDADLVVVVGAPNTGQLMYAQPGKEFQPVEHLPGAKVGERWAAFPRQVTPVAGQPVDQIMVLDGDGNLDKPLYKGPIARGLTFPDI